MDEDYDFDKITQPYKKYRIDCKDFEKDKKRKPIKSGCGSVLFVKQISTNKNCVEKKTNDPITLEEPQRLFLREIELLINCVHPAIVPFIGFSENKNHGIIYLEEAKNGSLDSILKDIRKGKANPNFNNTTKFIISYGIAKTMEFLHSQDRIHRDLKPGNILLDEYYHPLLTDFGTSKQIDNAIKVNQTLSQSTSTIMAPEFINDPTHTSNTKPIDVYSYGITLYEIWTELSPFAHCTTVFQVLSYITKGERPSIPESTPKNWSELIKSCWDENSESRPSFDDIVKHLNEGHKFYTEDMDIAKIEEYKKSLEITQTKSKTKPKTKPEESKPKLEPEPINEGENPMLTKMRNEAKSGDFNSQFNYVVALVDGTYGENNYDEALKYAKLYIAREGAFNKENISNTAIIEYYEGRCLVELGKYKDAYLVLKRSDGHGCFQASFLLAEQMFKGKISHRPGELRAFYSRAADNGITEAINKYSHMLYYGSFQRNDKPDLKKALEYFKKGAENGDPQLMYEYSVRMEYGRDVPKDEIGALELMKLSAEKGYAPAMIDYGFHLLNGIILAKDENEAKDYFQSAAEKNDPWGQLWYYVMCKNGSNLDDSVIDDETINEFLSNSLDSNACYEAWSVYGRELADNGDIEDAINSLKYALDNGSFNAALGLAEIFENKHKKVDANNYYKKAADFCHCLDNRGFMSPIKYKVFKCLDCKKIICEGCAKHCHKDHKIKEVDFQNGFKCECGKDGFKNKCSVEFIGQTPALQHLYQCRTCCVNNDLNYICKGCAESGHRNHKVIDCGLIRGGFCHCGTHNPDMHFNCQLCKK